MTATTHRHPDRRPARARQSPGSRHADRRSAAFGGSAGAGTWAPRSRPWPSGGGPALFRCPCGGSCPACDRAQSGLIAGLRVSQPGDPLEREAERVARQIAHGPGLAPEPSPAPNALTRCAGRGGSPRDGQRRSEGRAPGRRSPAIDVVLGRPGRSLDAAAGGFMEPRFGRDFGQVRIHTSPTAAEAARSVASRAFTMGRDIVFGAGQFAPHTTSGRELLAHELTHVVQQGALGGARRPPRHIQRTGDPDQRPIDLSCPVASSSPSGPQLEPILFEVGLARIGADGAEAIRNLVTNWIAEGASERLRIDGYASPDGPDALNWTLSCERALAVKRALMTPPLGGSGVPASFIEVYAHGETGEFGATNPPNRRAVVHGSRAPAHPPGPPGPPGPATTRVVGCSALPRQIFARGACGGGTDFTHHDFPSLAGASTSERAAVWEADNLTLDFQLRNRMRLELGLLAGSEGTRMVSHFSGGSGSRLTHGRTSVLGRDALGSATFTRLHRAVVSDIRSQLSRMSAAGVIDCNGIALSASSVPAVSFGFADGFALKGIIGGTQGLRVRLTSFGVRPGSRHYSVELQYLICDDFGVDAADLYSPALVAFWVLQHRRTGHLPFVNELDLPAAASGTY